jgi:glycosyltransferase involved in cell wall biosynthesis
VVSIVLVTYNRVKRLKLSIKDILNQTFKDFELIICDDCSPDSTEAVCKEFAAIDKRIRYFRHSGNLKMPANLNFGIQQSKYPLIAILHDGDRFKPDLIEQWYNAITAHESAAFVFNSIGISDAHENIVSSYHDFKEGLIPKDHLLKIVYFRRWQFNSPVYGEAMVRKKLIEENGYFKKRYGFYADVDMWMQLLHSHDAYYCADTLITGPLKTLQPRLFDDNLIKTFLYMFSMQLVHRKKAFGNKPLALVKELIICWIQAFVNLNYRLLLLVKNFSFMSFMNAAKLLKRSVIFLIPWIIILILYPLLYPFLQLFKVVKNLINKPVITEPQTIKG